MTCHMTSHNGCQNLNRDGIILYLSYMKLLLICVWQTITEKSLTPLHLRHNFELNG